MSIEPQTATHGSEMSQATAPIEFLEKSRTAFPLWAALSVEERLVYLRKLRLYMVHHLDEVSAAIATGTGKVLVEALNTDVLPVLEAIRHIEKHARHSLAPQKVGTPILLIGKKSYVTYQPRGVVLVISPWNFPLQLPMIPMLAALAAGNTVILKPSEVTPTVGQLIEELFHKVGFPKDVVQVAHGTGEMGAGLIEGRPDYIFFTGSGRTGRIIQQAAAKHLIPTTLELGGKDPMIVFRDAPMERAVQAALWGGLMNSGQVCMSVERVFVERPVYDEFLRRLVSEVTKLRLGTNENDDIGQMTFPTQVDIVRRHVEEALMKGAKMLVGTRPSEWPEGTMTIAPIVLTDVTPDMLIMREETFGPVLPIVPFDTEDEAVRAANSTVYGLSASVWTSDVERGRRVAGRLVTGNVLVNDVVITIVNQNLPFGGAKESGVGRYHGPEGLRMFTVQTATMVDGGRRTRDVNWFPYEGKYPLFAELLKAYYGPNRQWGRFGRAYLRLLRLSRK